MNGLPLLFAGSTEGIRSKARVPVMGNLTALAGWGKTLQQRKQREQKSGGMI